MRFTTYIRLAGDELPRPGQPARFPIGDGSLLEGEFVCVEPVGGKTTFLADLALYQRRVKATIFVPDDDEAQEVV